MYNREKESESESETEREVYSILSKLMFYAPHRIMPRDHSVEVGSRMTKANSTRERERWERIFFSCENVFKDIGVNFHSLHCV